MNRVALVFTVVLPLVVSSPAAAQSSDPQAGSFAAQSVSALTGGSAIANVKLTGSATRIAGSDQQTGAATLMAKGFAESRLDLTLSGGSRSEIRNGNANNNLGNWVGPDGLVNVIALHNCFSDTSWFFPALGSLAAAATNPNVVLTYLGQQSQGSSFQHIQAYTLTPGLPNAQALSTMDFYLDSQTLLPSIVMFNEHPDNDQLVNIAVEVMFSDYRNVNGAQIPFHIQRYVNDSLVLDVQITTATVNSGVSDDSFSVQ